MHMIGCATCLNSFFSPNNENSDCRYCVDYSAYKEKKKPLRERTEEEKEEFIHKVFVETSKVLKRQQEEDMVEAFTKSRDYSAKHDQGKINWSLLPWRAIERAANVMTIAATPKSEGGEGYSVDSWKTVKGGFYRYWPAMVRHMFRRFVLGEIIDPQFGEPHMAHMLCDVMFICERDLECAAGEMTEEEKKSWYERDV